MATILVVEDELDVQKVVAKRLSSRGFTVECASDGYQAVQKAHKLAPDLIVLDLQLPAGDGLGVLRKIRLSDTTRKTRIVVLTFCTACLAIIVMCHHVTSCRMRASRVGFASTYMAVVWIDVCPAISAIDLRSTPRSARRVISVRRPLCEDAPAMPASR